MFENIKSFEEFYSTENESEYYKRKLLEYKELLKIKQAITQYSKMKLFNIDDQQKKKYSCYNSCYENNSEIFTDSEAGLKKLSNCLDQCKSEVKDLKQFLKNVDKLVHFKNKTCHQKCEEKISDSSIQNDQEKMSNAVNFYRCRWMCENKLDRRYREFWLKQRDDIIERHAYKQF